MFAVISCSYQYNNVRGVTVYFAKVLGRTCESVSKLATPRFSFVFIVAGNYPHCKIFLSLNEKKV